MQHPKFLLLWATLLVLQAPGAEWSDEGRITVLDPVLVEASTGTPWVYVSVPGFEVLSHCPADFTSAYVRALQRATAARSALLPADFWGALPTPMKIVLYNRRPEPHEGLEPSGPIDLSWSGESEAIVGADAVQIARPMTLGDGDTFINCGNYWDIREDTGGMSVDPDSLIRIENRVPQFPAWFVNGLEGPCGVFADRLVRPSSGGGAVILRNALWTSDASTLALQEARRKEKKGAVHKRPSEFLPLGELFRGSYRREQRNLWDAETALLVRWGLYGSGRREAFLDFVGKSTGEPVTEGLFRAELGFGYAEAERRLWDYLPAAVSEPIRVPFDDPAEEVPEGRNASSTEVARIIGDWGRLEGKNTGPGLQFEEYRLECLDRAHRLFTRTNAAMPSDPLFLAAYGLYALDEGDELTARQSLERAAGAGVVRPRAYVELARLRLGNALPAIEEGLGDLGAADYAAVRGLLETARAQMPSLLGTYMLLARAMEHAPQKPAKDDLRVLDQALTLFPRNAALAYKVATVYREFGYRDEAAAIVRRSMGFAETDQGRALLSGFLAEQGR